MARTTVLITATNSVSASEQSPRKPHSHKLPSQLSMTNGEDMVLCKQCKCCRCFKFKGVWVSCQCCKTVIFNTLLLFWTGAKLLVTTFV